MASDLWWEFKNVPCNGVRAMNLLNRGELQWALREFLLWLSLRGKGGGGGGSCVPDFFSH